MKHLIMSVALLASVSLGVAAQIKSTEKPKKHHCTAACTNGKHVYAHGEKGHVCTDACKKAKS